jgi:hypothetical protein
LNPQKMNTMPHKPCLVVNGEMPPDIATKMGLEVKNFDPTVLLTVAKLCFCKNNKRRIINLQRIRERVPTCDS